jgi:hypothetical protein
LGGISKAASIALLELRIAVSSAPASGAACSVAVGPRGAEGHRL